MGRTFAQVLIVPRKLDEEVPIAVQPEMAVDHVNKARAIMVVAPGHCCVRFELAKGPSGQDTR